MSNPILERQRRQFLDAINNEHATELSRLLMGTPELGRVVFPQGWTGLMIAADNGSLSCVRKLLPFSDCKAINEQAQNALMRAVVGGHVECVRELLNARQHDLKHIDKKGRSALHLAALNGSSPCIHELIYGSDANALDQEQCSALELAAHQGYMTCADALADHVNMDILERVLAAQPDPESLPRAWALFERHQLQLSMKPSCKASKPTVAGKKNNGSTRGTKRL